MQLNKQLVTEPFRTSKRKKLESFHLETLSQIVFHSSPPVTPRMSVYHPSSSLLHLQNEPQTIKSGFKKRFRFHSWNSSRFLTPQITLEPASTGSSASARRDHELHVRKCVSLHTGIISIINIDQIWIYLREGITFLASVVGCLQPYYSL